MSLDGTGRTEQGACLVGDGDRGHHALTDARRGNPLPSTVTRVPSTAGAGVTLTMGAPARTTPTVPDIAAATARMTARAVLPAVPWTVEGAFTRLFTRGVPHDARPERHFRSTAGACTTYGPVRHAPMGKPYPTAPPDYRRRATVARTFGPGHSDDRLICRGYSVASAVVHRPPLRRRANRAN